MSVASAIRFLRTLYQKLIGLILSVRFVRSEPTSVSIFIEKKILLFGTNIMIIFYYIYSFQLRKIVNCSEIAITKIQNIFIGDWCRLLWWMTRPAFNTARPTTYRPVFKILFLTDSWTVNRTIEYYIYQNCYKLNINPHNIIDYSMRHRIKNTNYKTITILILSNNVHVTSTRLFIFL